MPNRYPRTLKDLPDLPTEPSFVIITQSRAIDYYGGEQDLLELEVFGSADEWTDEIKKRTARRDTCFKAFKLTPAQVRTTTQVEVR